MAAERRNRRYATYGSVAYQPEYEQVAAPARRSAQRPRREEEQVRRPRVQPRTQTVTRPSIEVRQQSAVAPFAIVGFVAVVLCALMLVVTSAQLAMVNDETVELRSNLSELQDEEKRLMAQYELAFDLAEVERQLTADGSMVKAGSGQTVYLDLSEGDNVVYYEAAEQGWSGVIRQIEQFLADLLS